MIVSWPFADGQISDFMQVEVLCKYLLLYGAPALTRTKRVFSSYSPSSRARDTYERTGPDLLRAFQRGYLQLPMCAALRRRRALRPQVS
ncbi:hypothetical protein BGW80DRAFT_1343860 [Lactifluus volemus]|nr:hypothetical protein BGW80DRAFT_1343860 [Lactifluus volemus]